MLSAIRNRNTYYFRLLAVTTLARTYCLAKISIRTESIMPTELTFYLGSNGSYVYVPNSLSGK